MSITSVRPVIRHRVVAGVAAALVVVSAGSALAGGGGPAQRSAAPLVRVPAGAIDLAAPSATPLLRQPSGRTFRAHLTPATSGGLFETAAGYTVARGKGGVWRYVTGRTSSGRLRLSTVAPPAPAPAGLRPHAGVRPTTVDPALQAARAEIARQLQVASYRAQLAAAASGQPRIFRVPALLLATWWDPSKGQTQPTFQPGHDVSYFKRLLNGFGGNPHGSVTQFYYEASFGQFIVEIDVYGPYVSNRSRQDRCYYGNIGQSGGPLAMDGDLDPLDTTLGVGGGGALGMALEAVPQANLDPSLDWARYDNNGDGRVDFTMIIHSGGDMAATGNPCFTWSHALQATLGEGEAVETQLGLPHGTLSHSGIPTSSPGVFVDRVLTIPEFASAADPLTIGVASHEMAHSLGEPDYYDTSYNSVGTGDFDIMSGGSYLGNPLGSDPALFNPATRVFQGWVTPTIVHGDLRHYRLRPRTVVPEPGYHVGMRDPNLLLVPTYEISQGQKDELGHTWSADDVYGLAKDPRTGKYVVEGFYVENVSREVKSASLHAGSSRGSMFDRMQHGSGLLVWHFDYWRQSTTFFAHGNDAQDDPNRYQMDVEEFDQNDNTQELQLNYSRGSASDYLVGAATGITSGTRELPPGTHRATGAPQHPIDLTGSTPVTPVTTDTVPFTVAANPNNAVMTVTAGSDNPAGDCTLELTDPHGATTPVHDSSGAGEPETITVKKPLAGTWKATVGDFAGCLQWSGRVVFSGANEFTTMGAADTWSNWTHRPTGWAFTNVSGTGNGLDVSDESGGTEDVTLDVLDLAGHRDVSPGFVEGAANTSNGRVGINVGRDNHLVVPVFSNGSRAPGDVDVVIHEGSPTGPVVARRTVRLAGYQRKDVAFTYRPAHEGAVTLATVVDPTNAIREADEHNQVQTTQLWAGPADPRVLVVDDDETLVHERALAGALAALGVPYTIETSHPTAAEMSRYAAVLWETGVDRYEGQLNRSDRANLRRYLDGGGRLLITSNRIFDAVGVGNSATTPQSTAEGVQFGAHYLGSRFPNDTYVVTQEKVSTATGRGLLNGDTLQLRPAPGRPFVGLAGLAQAGPGGLGTVIRPYGRATGVATLDPASMAAVQPEKDTPFLGVAVDGDAAHHHFKTVTLGWNLGDDIDAAATVGIVRDVLQHFGVALHTYRVSTPTPTIFHSTVREQVSGRPVQLTAVVLGGSPTTPVTLFYRRHGQGGFYARAMQAGSVAGTFTGVIPGNAVTPDGVDYYIRAGATYDPAGARTGSYYHGIASQLPEVAHPVQVLATSQRAPSVVQPAGGTLARTGSSRGLALAASLVVALGLALGAGLRPRRRRDV